MLNSVSPAVWLATIAWFSVLLLGDRYIHKIRPRRLDLNSSIIRSLVWVGFGIALGLIIWVTLGEEYGTDYFYGYVIEKALSIDNILVWGAILAYLNIPKKLQYKVLYWGVVGAVIFRAIFLELGTAIVDKYTIFLVVLGVILLISARALYRSEKGKIFDAKNSRLIKTTRKLLPFTDTIEGDKLFVKRQGKWWGTMLLFAIIIVEVTDVLFAFDSVPAIIAVVRNPYIALTSNVAAILGLRALYFVFAHIKDAFWMLNYGLTVVLSVLGVLLMLEPESIFGYTWFGVEVSSWQTFCFTLAVIFLSIVGSVMFKPKRHLQKSA